MMRQEQYASDPSFDQVYNAVFPAICRYIAAFGIGLADAEDISQNIMVEISEAPCSKVSDPRGLAYWLAKLRALDHIRKTGRYRFDSLDTETRGDEIVEYELPAKTADPVTILYARQWAEWHYEEFFSLLESRENQPSDLVRTLRRLVEERIPISDAAQDASAANVLRFLEARKIVFSGKTAEGDKRDGKDVELLAQRLNMRPSAVLTALNRLQLLWRDCELRTVTAESAG